MGNQLFFGQFIARVSCASLVRNFRLVCFGICSLLTLSATASGALIVDALNYDGHVKIGAVLAVEEHHKTANFTAPASNLPLPATNPPLPAGFQSANNLTITSVDLAPLAVLNGEIIPRMTIWIQNPSPADSFEVFDNPLNTGLTHPIRLDLSLYLEEIAANEQLVVHHRYEASDNIIPFASFAEVAPSTGRGSLADPLQLHLGLPASAATGDFTNGALKVLLFYETDSDVVPEPAAGLLALIGVALVGAIRRRS
jgi:MYXO-CTERM domain-containing protein